MSDRREEKCHHMLYSFLPLCNSRCSNTTVVAVIDILLFPSKVGTLQELCSSFSKQAFQKKKNFKTDKLTLLLITRISTSLYVYWNVCIHWRHGNNLNKHSFLPSKCSCKNPDAFLKMQLPSPPFISRVVEFLCYSEVSESSQDKPLFPYSTSIFPCLFRENKQS